MGTLNGGRSELAATGNPDGSLATHILKGRYASQTVHGYAKCIAQRPRALSE